MEVSLIAHLEAREGLESKLATGLCDLAKDVRKEPGNRLFQVYQRCDEPRRFEVVETYTNEAAFKAHNATPHSLKFAVWLKDVAVGGTSELTFLNALP